MLNSADGCGATDARKPQVRPVVHRGAICLRRRGRKLIGLDRSRQASAFDSWRWLCACGKGALAAGGMLREVRVTADRPARSTGTQWITAQGAAQLRTYMREAVTTGTGRVLAAHPVAIAGKTGTAEVDDQRSHSWFVGFAPFSGTQRIAFAVIVEHAGYGARVAAPVAGEIVSAAQASGLLQ